MDSNLSLLGRARTLGDLIRFQACDKPEKAALLFEEKVVSYRELDVLSNRIGNALIDAGLEAGSRVAVLDKNSDLIFQVLFGCAKIGATFVGVNWRLSAPEVAYILNDCEAELVFVGHEFHALIDEIEDELLTVKRLITLSPQPCRWSSFEAWRDAGISDDPEVQVEPDAVAVQMYTSGTTGHPKGVQLMHQSFLDIWCDAAYQNMPFEAPDEAAVNLVALPNFHVSGLNWGLRGLREGASNVILREFDAGQTLEAIQKHRIRKLVLVPATIRILLEHPKAKDTDFSSLAFIRYGASPIPLKLLRDAVATFRCGFVQVYGMTETGATGTYLPPEDHDLNGNERMLSAGKAQPGVLLKVVDESGGALPPGQVGEVCIASPANMKGYWKLPEATEATLIEGFVHTGDAGYLDEDGYLYIQDRLKDMIVSGGENIYPAEVESALAGHCAVADVAVIGVPDDRWGEAVKAFVVLRETSSASAEELIAFARERLASYKLPKSVTFVDELPRNPSGKVLKRELRRPYWVGVKRGVN